MLGEGRGRRRAKPPRKTLREPYAFSLDVRARLLPELEGLRVVDEGHADLLEHRLGVRLDHLERLGVQDLEIRDVALDVARSLDPDRRPLRPSRRAASA